MAISYDALTPDPAAISEFLTSVIGTHIHLAAKKPDGPFTTYQGLNDIEASHSWAFTRNLAGDNLYWTVNQTHPACHGKPGKQDIAGIRFAHVDIDPPKGGGPLDKYAVIAQLETASTPPTIIVDSGNGIQALWRLRDVTSDTNGVEAINRALALQFGGDNCHNIDRLLRVPGTVNIPDNRKQDQGRTPAMSHLIRHEKARSYALEELVAIFGQQLPPNTSRLAAQPLPTNYALLTSTDLKRGNSALLARMIDRPTEHFVNADRSAWAYGIACQMVDDGYSDAEALGILRNPANIGCAHIPAQADPDRAANRAVTRARQRFVPRGGSIFTGSTSGSPARPTIKIEGGALPDMVDQAEQALITANLGYYQSGGRIVRLATAAVIPSEAHLAPRMRLAEVGEAELVETLTRAVLWIKPGRNGDVPVNCPSIVAETYLARSGKWRLPYLTGVIDTPSLRPNGSLITAVGYDADTGLLLAPGQLSLPSVPDHPTREDAQAALETLLQPLSQFPFLADADRSVAISALLTAVCRPALSSAPIHGFSAPTAGSGKSTLVDIASILRTGRQAAPISQGKTTEELEKRLASLLMEGEGLVAIDNCEAPLGGDILCQLLTQPTLKVRPLGKSAMVEVSTKALVAATGNNLTFIGDMGRRALLCQLDPQMERPELRQFAFDPVQVALDQRRELVAAAITILRAYHCAGRPFQVHPLGSFLDWSNWVRSAIMWLSLADPCETMERVRRADPQMVHMKHVMAQWAKVIGQKAVTTADIQIRADEMVDPHLGSSARKYKHPEFRDALLSVAGEGPRINGRRLGRWLSAQKDRVVGGCKFVSPSVRGGQNLWVLQTEAAAPKVAPAEGG